MIVVDASVVAPALIDQGGSGTAARAALAGRSLVAPALLDLEVVSVFRRLVLSRQLDGRRAEQAVADLADLPIERAAHESLLARCWALHANLTPYDAAYVALAEALAAPLVTGDRRLATAPGLRCPVEVVSSG